MQAPTTPERIAPPSEPPTPATPSPLRQGLVVPKDTKAVCASQKLFPALAAEAAQWRDDEDHDSSEDGATSDQETRAACERSAAPAPSPEGAPAAVASSSPPEQASGAPPPPASAEPTEAAPAAAAAAAPPAQEEAAARAKPQLRLGMIALPTPGVSGVEGCMAGLTCVSTGFFPEVGGGTGMNVGKDRVKAMVQSFGGRVTGSLSGKTDILIVGKRPSEDKVSKARANPKITLISIQDLKTGIEKFDENGDVLAAATPVEITSFSRKRSAGTEGGPDAKKKKPAAAPKRSATDSRPRRKRAKPEAPVAVYKSSCMELFETDGDRGEDACTHCKKFRYYKYVRGLPMAQCYSKVPKAGYTDKAGTRYVGCKHPDGPQGGLSK